jgi:environmental stress-induced protein Ves
MNPWTLVALDSVPADRWRNGGGVTRELLALPSPFTWELRLSVADVEADGPFSRFRGVERWFAVLEGEGVRLVVDGTEHVCTVSGEPLRFDGGLPAQGGLVAGTTRDFNLMAPPGRSRMTRVRGVARFESQRGLLAAYSHAAPAVLGSGEQRLALPARTLAWCMQEVPVGWQVEGTDLLWMEVTP